MGNKLYNKITDSEFEEILNVVDTGNISDGCHTFNELYSHRCILFITLCKIIYTHIICNIIYENSSESNLDYHDLDYYIWSSKRHFGEKQDIEGFFILGLVYKGKQITYHIPIDLYSSMMVYIFSDVLENAPEWDRHSSNDVLERLKKLR